MKKLFLFLLLFVPLLASAQFETGEAHKVLNPQPTDWYKYSEARTPYSSRSQVIEEVPAGVRYKRQQFIIGNDVYFFRNDTTYTELLNYDSLVTAGGTAILDSLMLDFYPDKKAIKSKYPVKNVGTITVTNSSSSVTVNAPNEPNKIYFFTDSNGDDYQIFTTVNNGSGTINTVQSIEDYYKNGYDALGISSYPGVSGTYTIYDNYIRDDIKKAGLAFGIGTNSVDDFSVAIGHYNSAGYYGSAIGISNGVSGIPGTGVGFSNAVTGTYGTAVGSSHIVSGNLSTAIGVDNETTALNSLAIGSDANSTGSASVTIGTGVQTRKLLATAVGAIHIGNSTSSQTSGHGALAQYSTIIGGRDHNIPSGSNYSAVIGGQAIKVGSSVTNTVHMPKLRIGLGTNGALARRDTLNWIAGIEYSTGEIKKISRASLTAASAITGLIEAGDNVTIDGDGTTSDPYIINASSESTDWGGIGGTLSDQTDLQGALDAKQDVLTGLTATVAELNYTAGTTSNIQDQLDNIVGLTDGDKGHITVSGTGTVWTVDDNSLALEKIQTIAGNSVLGRAPGSTGPPAAIQATTNGYVFKRSGGTLGFGLLNTESYSDLSVTPGKIGTSGSTAGQVLTSNGSGVAPSWQDASGGGGDGTVTSVGLSAPTGFSVSGSPVTSSGTLALSYSAGYQGYTSTEASKLSGIASGATVGATWGTNLNSIPANVSAFGSLANGTGWLRNNGTGTLSYSTPTASDVGAIATSHTVNSIANGTGFLKNNGTGTWSYDNSTYLTTASASSTYLTQSNAASTYQPIGSYLTSEVDGSTTNELQSLSVPTGLSISGSGTTTMAVSYTAGYQGFTSTEASKLSGIASGAEVNVQSDWDAVSGDALILNKPTIPTNNNQLTNGAGYITGINSSAVTTALGYTPYNGSTNPNNYISASTTQIEVTYMIVKNGVHWWRMSVDSSGNLLEQYSSNSGSSWTTKNYTRPSDGIKVNGTP